MSSPLQRVPEASPASSLRSAVRDELPPLARLAAPVIAAEIGWMLMGIVDTLMVGPLGPAALGGVGVAGSLFFAVAVFGMGLLLGLDTVIAQAYGAGERTMCRRWLWQGLWLGLGVSLPLAALVVLLRANVHLLGTHPDVEPILGRYLGIVTLSLWPLLLYAAVRRYLQAIDRPAPVMFALLSANLLNAVANHALIHGVWGAPRLGTDGAAWATVICRAYMAAVLVGAALWFDRRADLPVWRVPRRPRVRELATLFRLGLPAAGQISLEVGVFALASATAARLTPAALAAHQIALNLAGLAFMVPLGLSSAAAVRVGHAVGRRDRRGVHRAGWIALGSAVVVMLGTVMVFVLVPERLLRLFTSDAGVVGVGIALLAVAALFAVFDGVQVTATGILRGIGDTRTPMAWNFVGHWLLGLPTGWLLCFHVGWGVVGLWLGLSLGLTIVAAMLVRAWAQSDAQVQSALRR
jgi:MATE family multidrug resistance protein